MKALFLSLDHWEVDAYIHVMRIRTKSHIYDVNELEALSQLYIQEFGDNTHLPKERLAAANAIKWGDMEGPEAQEMRNMYVELEKAKRAVAKAEAKTQVILATKQIKEDEQDGDMRRILLELDERIKKVA